LASLAYERLWMLGYRNIRVLDEGIPGWIEQAYPTEGAMSGHAPNHARDYAELLPGATR